MEYLRSSCWTVSDAVLPGIWLFPIVGVHILRIEAPNVTVSKRGPHIGAELNRV